MTLVRVPRHHKFTRRACPAMFTLCGFAFEFRVNQVVTFVGGPGNGGFGKETHNRM